jgi:hypothetical protein
LLAVALAAEVIPYLLTEPVAVLVDIGHQLHQLVQQQIIQLRLAVAALE